MVIVWMVEEPGMDGLSGIGETCMRDEQRGSDIRSSALSPACESRDGEGHGECADCGVIIWHGWG